MHGSFRVQKTQHCQVCSWIKKTTTIILLHCWSLNFALGFVHFFLICQLSLSHCMRMITYNDIIFNMTWTCEKKNVLEGSDSIPNFVVFLGFTMTLFRTCKHAAMRGFYYHLKWKPLNKKHDACLFLFSLLSYSDPH